MELEDLGYNHSIEKYRTENNLTGFEIGRVITEHKERYIVRTTQGEYEAEITGNLRFTARNREDFPAVGDWVAISVFDADMAVIHKIFPRYSIIKRQAVGSSGEVQVIAANIDYAFLVQALDRDFNINRLERYLIICNSSKVEPIIILSKADLSDEERIQEIVSAIKSRIENVKVIVISNSTQAGYDALTRVIERGKTYCLLGSSGVGKSTLLNNLSGKAVMVTDSISQRTNKGRHITTHRELYILDNGGILIDNPGMREVGIADTTNGLEVTFNKIVELSQQCKFEDCTHIHEKGCAVREAIENGELDQDSYENYLKMFKEKEHFESTLEERRKKDKSFGKFLKNYKKEMKKNH